MRTDEPWTVSVTFISEDAARDFARSIYDYTLIEADVYRGEPRIRPAQLEQIELDITS